MSYYVKLEQSLFKSIKSALKTVGHPNVEVRFAGANNLEPTSTYCVLNILSVGQVGVEVASFKGREDDPLWMGDFTTPATYYAFVQISVLGKDSLVVAPKLKSAVTNNRIVLDEFRNNGLGTTTRGELRNIPQNRESGFVQMMNFDILFCLVSQNHKLYCEFIFLVLFFSFINKFHNILKYGII